MSDSNYADILQQSWSEIPEPKVLPVGSYLLKGSNATFQKAKDETKNPSVLMVFQPKEAMDDVDQAALAELGDNYEVTENSVFHRVYIERKSDWDKVRKILAKMGVSVEGSLEESFKAFRGAEVIGYLDQNTYTNGEGNVITQNVIKEFAPVEA